MLHCSVCGNDWEPRVEQPKICPRCKHRDWNVKRQAEVKDNVDVKQSATVGHD
jgi:Zn finger protein HypA/HybF involved in hydrogenase expression